VVCVCVCRCIPCPAGEYVDRATARCQACPAGTVVRGLNAWGVESCVRCGEGLTAVRGTHCVTSCRYNSTDARQYDFTPLAGYRRSLFCSLAVLDPTVGHTIDVLAPFISVLCLSVHQAAKLVAALLRVVGMTAGLAESNGSLPPGL